MSTTSSLQNSLFETMKIFSDYAAQNSNATITIEGQIKEVIDPGAGEYSVEYLGNTFTAHSANNATYAVGDNVYITVPDGDFEKEKIVLGTVQASTDSYIKNAESAAYSEVSDNLIDADFGTIKLSSYGTTRATNYQDITNYTSSSFGSLFKGYLEDYRTFAFSFSAKTSLAVEQQIAGNYGISLQIPVIAASETGGGSTTKTWKTVTLDVGNMIGNPYRLTVWSPQILYFTIDSQYTYDDSRVPQIAYFCYDFARQDETKARTIQDIWMKDISFTVVNRVTEDQNTGYSLSLKATQGEYFSTFYSVSKTITPTLKVNGKTTSLKKATIYWFRENAEIKADNSAYVSYGGYGWECLNAKTNIATTSEGITTFDYITDAATLDVKQDKVQASARYKCVVVYNSKVVSAIIKLKNLKANCSFTLEGTDKTNVFLKDTGFVKLSAIVYYDGVTNSEKYRDSIKLSWLRYDKNGNYIYDEDKFFNVTSYNRIEDRDGKACYITDINFPVNQVEDTNLIYCSAKYVRVDDGIIVETLIGTAEMPILTSTDYNLNLVINGDDVIYKYDTDGDSPTGIAYDGPSTSKVNEIQSLTYTLRKGDGTELTEDEYRYAKYTWKITKNGMISVSGDNVKSDKDYYYITGYGNTNQVAYTIASRYNVSKAANTVVTLTVEFQNQTVSRNASISFLKEGMSGTNGSAYAAELVWGGLTAKTSDPYGTLTADGLAKKLKFVYNINSKVLYYYDFNNKKLVPWNNNTRNIYARVWENSTEIASYTVEWSMFDKDYTNPCFSIAASNGSGQSNYARLGLSATPATSNVYCNILQAKITVSGQSSIANQNEILYVYYPIELTMTNFDTPVIPSLDGGFAEVMYASDGTNPSWDETSPFTINDDNASEVDLNDYFTITWEAQHHLNKSTSTGRVNNIKPTNKYDDGNSKNYVKATLTFNSQSESKLNNSISELNDESRECQSQIDIINANRGYLEKFAAAWKESTWLSGMLSAKELFNKETDAIYQINSLLTTSLVSIDNYLNLQKNYNNATVQRYCAKLFQEISNVKAQAQKALVQVQKMDGTSGYDYENLVSLANYKLSWTSTIRQEYLSNLGVDFTLTIEMLIQDINSQIDEYESRLNSLKKLSSTDYLKTYREIVDSIKTMCGMIPDTAMARYVELKNSCLNYVKRFNSVTSITDLENIITGLYQNILKGTFILNDGTLVVSAAAQKEIEAGVENYKAEVSANNELAQKYTNLLAAKNKTIIHIRPIVLYFDRYEMSNINAWDGNKIETGDGTYLLAPQVGAGIKESDNSFTGMVMGMKNVTGRTDSTYLKKGLFGYYHGEQTLALDASNGSAIFGKSGKGGQIIIDPTSTEARLYSSTFYKNYDRYTGLPSNYNKTNESGSGLMIDLSTPEIKYGSGYFTVDKDGNLHAGGGGDGDVGGWNITNTALYSGNYKANKSGICLDAKNDAIIFGSSLGKTYSGKHNAFGSTQNGFYLDYQGLSIGAKFKASSDGKLEVGKLSGKHWTIDGSDSGSYIGYNASVLNNTASTSVYLGTDGMKIGNTFKVTSAENGNLYVGRLTGQRYWTIGGDAEESFVKYGNKGQNGSAYLGTDGIWIGNGFYATREGDFKVGSATKYITFNHTNGAMEVKGTIKGDAGYIGGWTIQNNTLIGDSNSYIEGGTIKGSAIDGGEHICFKARRGYIQIGDFKVDDDYGRHIFQSDDECTGMSTGDISGDELYLWAGYGEASEGEAVLAVNANSEVHVGGHLFINGHDVLPWLEDLESRIEYLESHSSDDDDDSGGGHSGGGGSGGGGGGSSSGGDDDESFEDWSRRNKDPQG